MAIAYVDAKLREAGSYLNQMRDQQNRAFGDHSKFDDYLERVCRGGPIGRAAA